MIDGGRDDQDQQLKGNRRERRDDAQLNPVVNEAGGDADSEQEGRDAGYRRQGRGEAACGRNEREPSELAQHRKQKSTNYRKSQRLHVCPLAIALSPTALSIAPQRAMMASPDRKSNRLNTRH